MEHQATYIRVRAFAYRARVRERERERERESWGDAVLEEREADVQSSKATRLLVL